jgi:hypothetical protein
MSSDPNAAVLAGIMACAYRTIPAHHLQVNTPGSHRRADFATAYDTAVSSLEEAGLHRDTIPDFVTEAMLQMRAAAKGTSPGLKPIRQQQMHASLLVADAMSRLIAPPVK